MQNKTFGPDYKQLMDLDLTHYWLKNRKKDNSKNTGDKNKTAEQIGLANRAIKLQKEMDEYSEAFIKKNGYESSLKDKSLEIAHDIVILVKAVSYKKKAKEMSILLGNYEGDFLMLVFEKSTTIPIYQHNYKNPLGKERFFIAVNYLFKEVVNELAKELQIKTKIFQKSGSDESYLVLFGRITVLLN